MGFFVGKAVSNWQPEVFGCEPGKAQKPQFFLLSPQKIDIYFGEEGGKREIPTRHHNSHKERTPSKDNKSCPDPRRDKIPGIKPNFGAVHPPTPWSLLFPLSLGICAGIEGNSREGFGARSSIFNPFVPSPRRGAGGSRPWLSPVAAPAR